MRCNVSVPPDHTHPPGLSHTDITPTHIDSQMMLQKGRSLWDTCCKSLAPVGPDRFPEDTEDTPPPWTESLQDRGLRTQQGTLSRYVSAESAAAKLKAEIDSRQPVPSPSRRYPREQPKLGDVVETSFGSDVSMEVMLPRSP